MSSSNNRYDSLEQIIFEEGLRIVGIHCYKKLDLMLIVLNSKKILKRQLSNYPRLTAANSNQLLNYQLISDGVAIHWPDVDEDISLKGLLKEEFSTKAAAA